MPKYFILILIVSLTYSQVYSQKDSTTQSSITISTGLNQGYFKDLNYSPLNYSSSGINYWVAYSKKNVRNIFLTSLEFSNNKLNTIQQTGFPKSKYLQGRLKIAYLKSVNRTSNKVNFFIGGQYQSNINYIDFIDESTTFLVAHSFDFSFYGIYHFNKKHAINTSISLPLITLIVRPPYSGIDEELEENLDRPFYLITNGKFTSVDKYISPSFSIRYKYNLSRLFSLSGEYQMNYQKLISSDTFVGFQNQIRIELNYKF